jgi:hypothetical protein
MLEIDGSGAQSGGCRSAMTRVEVGAGGASQQCFVTIQNLKSGQAVQKMLTR